MNKKARIFILILLITMTQTIIYAEDNKVIHEAYINGFLDKTFKANNKITREEASSILSKTIVNSKNVEIKDNVFEDLKQTRWSYKDISKLNNLNIISLLIEEDKDGGLKVYPEKELTRGEFIEILKDSYDYYHTLDIDLLLPTTKDAEFLDVKGHKYEDSILEMASRGIIDGYPDNTFRPDEKITRGEFVKVYNRYLKRDCKIDGLENINTFKDVKKTDWYFNDVVEASFYHLSEYKNGNNYMVKIK